MTEERDERLGYYMEGQMNGGLAGISMILTVAGVGSAAMGFIGLLSQPVIYTLLMAAVGAGSGWLFWLSYKRAKAAMRSLGGEDHEDSKRKHRAWVTRHPEMRA